MTYNYTMPPQFENNIPTVNNQVSENNPAPQKSFWCKYGFLISLMVLLILTGVFGVWYFSNPLPPEETETVAVVNKFVDWKTYKNEEYGFEFKYPKDWVIRSAMALYDTPVEKQSSIYAVAADSEEYIGSGVTIHVDSKFADPKSFEKIANEKFTEKIGEFTWTIYHFHLGEPDLHYSKGAHVKVDGKDYYFVSMTDSNYKNEKFDQILSTFKFISTSTTSINTSNWKTYSNPDLGFSFKYPNDWILGSLDGYGRPTTTGVFVTFPNDEMGSNGISISRVAMNLYASPDLSLETLSSTTVTVNGINWVVTTVKEKVGDMEFYSYKSIKDGFIYIVSSKNIPYTTKYINSIISTFKFISSTNSGQVSTSTPAN